MRIIIRASRLGPPGPSTLSHVLETGIGNGYGYGYTIHRERIVHNNDHYYSFDLKLCDITYCSLTKAAVVIPFASPPTCSLKSKKKLMVA